MIDVYISVLDDIWYGIAYADERIVATSVGFGKQSALKVLLECLPSEASHRVADNGSGFAERMIHALREAHLGVHELEKFSLATEYYDAPIARILQAAAVIPVGYVASYGEIAKVSDTEPKLVGQVMASNPLYPIVACHRVVGADFSLVGYGGSRRSQSLNAKMERIKKERRGATVEKTIHVLGKTLTVYPVEYVIEKASNKKPNASTKQQRTLSSF